MNTDKIYAEQIANEYAPKDKVLNKMLHALFLNWGQNGVNPN